MTSLLIAGYFAQSRWRRLRSRAAEIAGNSSGHGYTEMGKVYKNSVTEIGTGWGD